MAEKPPFKEKAIKLSMNLVDSSLKHLEFLDQVDKYPLLQKPGPVIRNAICRYEEFWLPLAAELQKQQKDVKFLPPLDVAWVWHCHMLSPYYYENDCIALVGEVIDHKTHSFGHGDHDMDIERVKLVWSQHYPGEPFHVDLRTPPTIEHTCTHESKCAYNLEQAVTRQSRFFYNVSLPHYRDASFLASAVKRYKRFLHLKLLYPKEFLVPCYDIDLVWHTHQLHPIIYNKDTSELLGRMLNHDDQDQNREPGSILALATTKTKEIWHSVFDDEYSLPGTMSRGGPSRGKLVSLTSEAVYDLASKRTHVVLSRVGLNTDFDEAFSLRISLARGTSDTDETSDLVHKVISLKGPKREWVGKNDGQGLKRFIYDSGEFDYLRFELVDKSKFLCLAANTAKVSSSYSLLSLVENSCHAKNTWETKDETLQVGDTQIKFSLVIDPPVCGTCFFKLMAENFENAVMPENIEKLWGPVPLPILPDGLPNTCKVASHKLLNHADKSQLTCRVIHSLPLLMSAVQIFHKDKMVATAHLIGSGQLPCISQVSDRSCITLDEDSRAVIIKDADGDWAICVGKWKGFKPGIPVQPGVVAKPCEPGHLNVSYYNLRTGESHKHIRLPDKQCRYHVQIESLMVDLLSGTFKINPDTKQIHNYIALGFTLALLQVLCQPRPPPGGVPSDVAEINVLNAFPSESLAMVVAAGFLTDTPNTSYIREELHAGACGGACTACTTAAKCGGDSGECVAIMLL